MPTLTSEQKRFVVRRLACFDSPTEAAEAVKEEFGIEIDRRNIQAYDPTKALGKNLSKPLRQLFDRARKRFLEHEEDIPIAHRSYRLEQLLQMARRARKNLPLKAQLLEQAAKEMGDIFRRSDRMRLDNFNVDIASLSPSQVARIAAGEDPVTVVGGVKE